MFSTLTAGSMANADCVLIDRLDQLHTIQSRLVRSPDAGLFATDLRQLRGISAEISDRDVLDAIDGNRARGRGADFMRFLQDIQGVLQQASFDDPQSIRHQITPETFATLDSIANHLKDLRCTPDQIAIGAATAAARSPTSDSDAEDLAEIFENLIRFAKEALRPRNLFIAVTTAIIVAWALPHFQNWRRLLRRKAKRHNIQYLTQYKWAGHRYTGTLVDISCHGTKLKHDAEMPPPLRTIVGMTIGDDLIEGTVIWNNMHYSGVQFRKAVSLATVKLACKAVDHPEKQNGAPRDAA